VPFATNISALPPRADVGRAVAAVLFSRWEPQSGDVGQEIYDRSLLTVR
jgi:hypothetical protein